MPFRDERQVRSPGLGPYGSGIANGPPDTETLDRRRVDPPAGCRAAAEPANVLKRRSVETLSQTPAIRAARMAGFFVSGAASTARRAALVAEEPLDVGDEVVA
jgi:hypothetical protein